jgi:hypothetical protein
LYKALQQAVQDMGSKTHQLDILQINFDNYWHPIQWQDDEDTCILTSNKKTYIGCAIHTLPINNWSFKHVSKLAFGAQEVWSNKINHAPIFHEVVL